MNIKRVGNGHCIIEYTIENYDFNLPIIEIYGIRVYDRWDKRNVRLVNDVVYDVSSIVQDQLGEDQIVWRFKVMSDIERLEKKLAKMKRHAKSLTWV